MNTEREISHLESFKFEIVDEPVEFVETTSVRDGVECDVYEFTGNKERDLGIIRMKAGASTPLQLVEGGERTVEGYISGSGTLTVTPENGFSRTYLVMQELSEGFQVNVAVGETMQWKARDEGLKAFEVCFPPYEKGRFKDLDE